MPHTSPNERDILLSLFEAVVETAQPRNFLAPALDVLRPPAGRTIVVAAGKAALGMAEAVDHHWQNHPLEGIAVSNVASAAAGGRIRTLVASHPIPDERSAAAGRAILALVSNLQSDDMVIFLISGGASSLLAVPPDGISLDDLRTLHQQLQASGMPIQEMNVLRKRVSAIAGGRLAAAAYPAQIVTLAVSDIPNDDISAIGSGPTLGDSTAPADVEALLRHYGIQASPAIEAYLRDTVTEAVRPDDLRLATATASLVFTPADAFRAATSRAAKLGLDVQFLGADLVGEAAVIGAEHAKMVAKATKQIQQTKRDALFLSGGELSVTLAQPTTGRGGRNQEYLLALAIALRGRPGVYALAADTDGQDGSDPVAGAFICPGTLDRLCDGVDEAKACLERHDALEVFSRAGGVILTGPTGTNVNDFRAILVRAQVEKSPVHTYWVPFEAPGPGRSLALTGTHAEKGRPFTVTEPCFGRSHRYNGNTKLVERWDPNAGYRPLAMTPDSIVSRAPGEVTGARVDAQLALFESPRPAGRLLRCVFTCSVGGEIGKLRSCLVLSRRPGNQFTVLPITTQQPRDEPGLYVQIDITPDSVSYQRYLGDEGLSRFWISCGQITTVSAARLLWARHRIRSDYYFDAALRLEHMAKVQRCLMHYLGFV